MGRKGTTKRSTARPAAKVLTRLEVEHLASAFRWLGFDEHPTTLDRARSMGKVGAQRFVQRPPSPVTVETVIVSAKAHVSALAAIRGFGLDVMAAYVHSFREHLPDNLKEHTVPKELVGAMKPKPISPRKRQSGRAD